MSRDGFVRIVAVCIAAVSATAWRASGQIDNPGFESGTEPWFGVGASLSASTDVVRSGGGAARLTGRTAFWNSIAQSINGELTAGEVYRFRAWVRAEAEGNHFFKLTARKDDAGGTDYIQIAAATLPGRQWHELSGLLQYEPDGAVSTLWFYAEGPDAGVDLLLDDVSVEALGPAGDWVDEANQRIESIRKRDAELTVVDSAGEPIEGAALRIEQVSSEFAFGSAIAASGLGIPQYEGFFAEHFEWAVPENAGKWPSTEPIQGDLQYGGLDAIVGFARNRGIRLRGHTVFWAVDQFVQPWVQALSDTELLGAMQQRIDGLLNRHPGAFEHWDVNNEMLHGSFYADRLGDSIRPWMFSRVAQANAQPLLFVNDYNVVTSGETGAYVSQIQGLLDVGAPVAGIGAQGHFYGEVRPRLVLDRLDQLAEVGLPIWITELDVGSEDPAVRADRLEEAMRACFSHPAVEGILLWGFWEGRHWRGADAALVDLDWTVNEAGLRLIALLDEWTTEADLQTQVGGAASFRGFHGEYRATITLPDGTAAQRVFTLPKGDGVHRVTIEGPLARAEDCDGDLADSTGFGPPDGAIDFGDFFALSFLAGPCE